jgi:hypothetical protein
MIPHKKVDLPSIVSGRTVTNRGVHLLPAPYHGDWLKKSAYWIDLLVEMGISWVVILNDGDSVRQEYKVGVSPLKLLLDAGVIPIIREHKRFPNHFTDRSTFEWTVDLYGQYGLKPPWIIHNEPFDQREWEAGRVPRNAWPTVMKVWAQGAQYMASKGGLVGFPDGPLYSFNPFESIKAYDCRWMFDEGRAFFAGHHYGKNRHRDYPYDAVTRYGAQLSEKEYARLLDDYAGDPAWREPSLEMINERRGALRSPGLTAIQDGTCWRGWEQVARWSLDSLGYVAPMAMTEGGWVPRDRPGTGQNTDVRVPHTTPRMVATKTLQMYEAPSPFFALCPWLLADDAMVAGGYVGWPFDSWVGWAYTERYGSEKPVVTLLKRTPPKEVQPRTEPWVVDIEGDTRDWSWVRDTHGARYHRGRGPLRLIEVHEYEGEPSLDVLVVDGVGLPVEGVPFYYYYPRAPVLSRTKSGTPPGEWYPRGLRRMTGPDGRVSFRLPLSQRAGNLRQGAVWPQGKGDLLWRLGLIEGSANRHVNGVWQLVEKSPPPLGLASAQAQSAALPQPPSQDRWALVEDKLREVEELLSDF